jgi:hypothetical protein
MGISAGVVNLATPGPVVAYAGPCRLKGVFATNPSGAIAYIQIFDLARTPNSADTPLFQLAVPFASTTTEGKTDLSTPLNTPLLNGLAYWVTTTKGGSTAVATGAIEGTIDYVVRS